MAKIAIIGTGIAGLACGAFLHRQHEIRLFEKNAQVGGLSHTLRVPGQRGGEEIAVDTGLSLFNKVTSPQLTQLFEKLHVSYKPTHLSFSVCHEPAGLEFCCSSLNHLFAQRRNLVRPRFLKLLWDISRFNRDAVKALRLPATSGMTLAEFVQTRRYGRDFVEQYLVPMSSGVWSTPPDKMMRFPAELLLRFFHDHGFLGMHTQHPWYTVTGGSRGYVSKLAEPFRERIQCGNAVQKVRRTEQGVTLLLQDGTEQAFDRVILACHADDALRLLDKPSTLEGRLLGEFGYQSNPTLLHTDERVMPRTRLAWASCNYRVAQPQTDATSEELSLADEPEEVALYPVPVAPGQLPLEARPVPAQRDGGTESGPAVHYWMNRLQQLPTEVNYFVSLNDEARIDPEKIIHRIHFTHPVFTLDAVRFQPELRQLNRTHSEQNTYYCGSYFRYGFHEDALLSAVELCEVILGRSPWQDFTG